LPLPSSQREILSGRVADGVLEGGKSDVQQPPSPRMKIGEFLLRRLKDAGVRHLFGVPGDYNLELLQQLQDSGAQKWVGTCSELNASNAADGYARLSGLGALLVTNGVGALSAINGVGGSYSKHVPVICIAGSIPLRSIDRGLGMHHTMADGSYDHFLDAYAHVTAAQARLTPRNAATEIDRLILTAWREKLPVVHRYWRAAARPASDKRRR
jgi:indolepyruvate decarboxylase